MAKAKIIASAKPSITLDLSGDEAEVLYTFLVKESWPADAKYQRTLNAIYTAVGDAGVETGEAESDWGDDE